MSEKANLQINYFPNFYGFRFVAALGIVVLHITLMSSRFGLSSFKITRSLDFLSLGVDFFFVLSGFLITSLVVSERTKSKFSLRRFYIKRALRILPIYYFSVLVIFFGTNLLRVPPIPGMPLESHFLEQLNLHLLLLPHVAKSYLPFVPYGGQLWSIGVEVMFYIIWPLLLLVNRPILTVVGFVGLNIVLKILVVVTIGAKTPIGQFLAMSRFEILAMGGLAFLLYEHLRTSKSDRLYNLLISKLVMIFLILIGGFVTFVFYILESDAIHLVAAAWFCILLISSVSGVLRLPFLENPTIRYLGEISYGIYVWHYLAIGFVISVLLKSGFNESSFGFFSALFLGSIFLTILVSVISFELLERPINRLRKHV